MVILYGGAFNPPTIGHVEIIKYLLEKYHDYKIIILPANNDYKSQTNIDFHHRVKMLEIIKRKINNNRLIISDYELGLDEYEGTYNTLEHFNHPYFVIGSDALSKIELWIMYPNVVIDNKFIVFPRDGYNIKEIFNSNILLQEYRENFIIIEDFHEIDVSSTEYRNHLNKRIVLKEVEDYIKANNLYEVN